MKEYRKILRRVGLPLVIFGLLDIGIMVYSLTRQTNYFAIWGILSFLTGLFLLTGSLKAARVVRWFVSFGIIFCLGIVLIFPLAGISIFWFHEPFELQIQTLRLDTFAITLAYLILGLGLGFYFWVYHNLSLQLIIEARNEAGLGHMHTPVSALVLGGTLVIGISAAMFDLDETIYYRIARNKAEEIYGDSYSYHVSDINYINDRVHAMVKAYKHGEILLVELEWHMSLADTYAVEDELRP